MNQVSPEGGRTTGSEADGAMARIWSMMLRRSLGPCSESITSQSKPALAAISAGSASPVFSQRPICGRPALRAALKAFFGAGMSSLSSSHCHHTKEFAQPLGE
jgi:hypothetical protein